MLFLFLIGMALAQDAAPVEADPGIIQVPDGTVLTFPASSKLKPFTTTQYSFLLPEPMYDMALIKAKKLAICEPALDKSTEQTLKWIEVSDKALTTCTGQFDIDQATVDKLESDVKTLEVRALTAEGQLKDTRVQRNTAWAITSGIIIGAVAVTAIALGT